MGAFAGCVPSNITSSLRWLTYNIKLKAEANRPAAPTTNSAPDFPVPKLRPKIEDDADGVVVAAAFAAAALPNNTSRMAGSPDTGVVNTRAPATKLLGS